VLVHQADIDMARDPDWQQTERQIFPTLGFTDAQIAALFASENYEWVFPEFTAMADRTEISVGGRSLVVEHHAGHTPGHVWVVDESSGAIFVGDYLIANHPTNAGMELNPGHPSGRAQLLVQYNEGLRELASRDAPALFPGHGPPITDHQDLIQRRLAKSDRRTRNVLEALRESSPTTALALGTRLYRDRAATNWEVIADLIGRLDVLIAEGRAASRMGEDGAWYFSATD
jgi:glyoxylase-like metal-dependent hydrolase (beta-lactamase superfamily II)